MQRSTQPLLLVTAMHPAREHDVTSLQKIPPAPDGTHPGSGRPVGDAVQAADTSPDCGCTGCTGSAGRLACPAPPRAVVLLSNGPRQGRPGTFRKSIPPGTARGSSPFFSAAKLPGT